MREDREPHLGRQVARAAAEPDGTRLGHVKPFEHRDVRERLVRREGLAIGVRERLGIAGRERSAVAAGAGSGELLAEPVAPGPDDAGDLGLECRGVPVGRARLVQSNDEVSAGERTLRIIGFGERHAAAMRLGEIGTDPRPHERVVPVLRYVDEQRHEPPEAVRPRQHADTRPLGQRQDRQGEAQQPLCLDLEEIVARVILEHVGQRAPGMARRVEAGSALHLGDLAAEVGNVARRTRIGGGGEEADDPHLAGERAVRREEFRDDIVEMDRPVDARSLARLGDDQRLRPVAEGHDLGQGVDRRPADRRDANIAGPQEAERRAGEGRIEPAAEVVGRDPERGEMPVAQPGEEGRRLAVVGRGRGVPAGVIDERVEQGRHRARIVARERHVGIDAHEPVDQAVAQRAVVDPVDMDVDQALAGDAAARLRRRLADDAAEQALAVALDAEDRMRHEQRREALRVERHQGRVEQEGAVVVDDLDERQVLRAAVARDRDVDEPRFRRASGAARALQAVVGVARQHREFFGLVGREIVRGHPTVEVTHESAGLPRPIEKGLGLVDPL